MSGLNLSNKRVIVTGAAGGLGRAFAVAFAAQGARVLACDLAEEGAQETAELCNNAGGKGFAAKVDVTNTQSCNDLVSQAVAKMGGVDVLVNNAAIYAGLTRSPFEDIDEALWDKVMSVNVKGVWQMSRAVAPVMRDQKAGSIVNIASATVFSGSPLWMHYVASKGAVISMSRTMAKELGPDGVRVNVIAPGFTLTEASLDLIENAASYGVDRAALRRPAEVEDITGGALYLASDLSSYMTGQTVVIDGGRQFI